MEPFVASTPSGAGEVHPTSVGSWRPTPARPGRTLLATALLLLVSGVAGGCGPRSDVGDPDLSVRLGVSPTPAIQGPTRLLVEASDGSGPAPGGRVEVGGTPPGRGAAASTAVATPEGLGRWVVPAFDFAVPGEWVLEVTLVLDDGRRAVRRFPVRVTGRGGG